MALRRFRFSNSTDAQLAKPHGQKGIALVNMVVLLPLILTLTLSLGLAFYVLKRKSLAQALCVSEAARLQENLRRPLRQLIRLNTRATTLRAQRRAADQALTAATLSGIPYAIAVAKAVQTAVIAEQVAFHLRQLALLSQAEGLRAEGRRSLRARAMHMGAQEFTARSFYHRALAVEPLPVDSLTPDYKTVPFFERAQQERFHFQVPLTKEWRQLTECSVTLQGESKQWDLRILAAKAQPNS